MLRLLHGCNLVSLLDTRLITLLWRVVVAAAEHTETQAAEEQVEFFLLLFHCHLELLTQ
jgi:hypothetical protein